MVLGPSSRDSGWVSGILVIYKVGFHGFQVIFGDFKGFRPFSRDFTLNFKDFRDFTSGFKVKHDFRDFGSYFMGYRDFRDFRSDFMTFVHRISEVVGPSY